MSTTKETNFFKRISFRDWRVMAVIMSCVLGVILSFSIPAVISSNAANNNTTQNQLPPIMGGGGTGHTPSPPENIPPPPPIEPPGTNPNGTDTTYIFQFRQSTITITAGTRTMTNPLRIDTCHAITNWTVADTSIATVTFFPFTIHAHTSGETNIYLTANVRISGTTRPESTHIRVIVV
ncbi:MAG: hypothetical protein FWE38_05180 [Firmicutes bacterium]|nr:hypothetical protein [Bacillota bacterium]